MFLLSQDYWEIRQTAHKGRGVFARKDIPAGTVLGDYIGRVIRTAEENTLDKEGHVYLMYYHDRASIYPEVQSPGVHILNHSCTPNSWIKTYRGHNLFITLRHIFPGEELTVSYLLSPKDESCGDECTHPCTCGSLFCTGTMHLSKKQYEAWNDYEQEDMKKTKRQRIRFGKTLPLLNDYPSTVPDHPIFPLFGAPDQAPEIISGDTLPPIPVLRKKIRDTGKTLLFAKSNLHIFGIANDALVTKDSPPYQ